TALRNTYGIIGMMVRDSSAIENAGDGILLSTGGAATGNVSSFNGGVGINAPFSTVTGNTLFVNRGGAISGSCPSVIANNTIVSPQAVPINMEHSGCALLNNATVQN